MPESRGTRRKPARAASRTCWNNISLLWSLSKSVGNDFLRRRPQQAVKEDVRHLLRTVRQSGAQVVLVAVPEVSLLNFVMGKGDAPLYQELAEEEAVPLIDRVFAETLSRPELRADQIHPNAEGYRHMASGIYDYLKQAGAI
jgi:acyl-CoA thioesterase-1